MCNSWPVCYDGLLDCGDPIASLAEADYRNTPHPTLFTRFLVHGAGAVNACWGWSRRGPRQSRGARGRSHSNRSAEIAGSAQPGVAAPESGASFKEGNLLAPLPPSCNPVSSLHSTRIEPSGMFGNTHSGLFCQSLRACIAPAQTLYRTQELGLAIHAVTHIWLDARRVLKTPTVRRCLDPAFALRGVFVCDGSEECRNDSSYGHGAPSDWLERRPFGKHTFSMVLPRGR